MSMPAKTPEECDHLFAQHMNEGNVDAVAALYEPGATLVLETGSATGPAAIREALSTFAAMRPKLRMNVTKTIRVGDELAMVYNDWNLTAKQPDGTEVSDSGRAIEVMRRQADGSWRFVVDDPRARG